MHDPSGRLSTGRSLRRPVRGACPSPGSLLTLGVVCSVALLAASLRPRGLDASGGAYESDPDRDGLVSAQEAVLGTSPTCFDSDGDGYSDAEELARKSSPLDPASTPGPKDLEIGMTLRGQGGLLYLVAAIYAAEGGLQGTTLSFGVLAGDRLVGLAPHSFLAAGRVVVVPGSAPGSRVAVLEVPIHPAAVHAIGELTFMGMVGRASTGTVVAADARTIHSDGTLVYLLQNHVGATSGMVQQGPGSVYLPIPPGGSNDIPVTATPGEICFQATQVVGVVGPVLVQEVVSADCLSDWDAHCRPDCAATVGDTFRAVDPTVLVGL